LKTQKIPKTLNYQKYKNLVLEKSHKLNFKPDGREHYVYRVTDYTRTEEMHYIGSHTPKKGKKYSSLTEEFWSYRTSSRHNTLDENQRKNYKIKILKVFNNQADKIIYESFLHQYFNVKLNAKFWNKSNQTSVGFDTTGLFPAKDSSGKYELIEANNPRYLSGELKTTGKGITRSLTEETKNKISESRRKGLENGTIVPHKGMVTVHLGDRKFFNVSTTEYQNNKTKYKNANAGVEMSQKQKDELREIAKNKPKLKCPYCDKESSPRMASRWHFDNCKKKPGNENIDRTPHNKGVKGTKQEIVICPHCNKTGGLGSMKRWHFDNCKKINFSLSSPLL